MLRKLPWHKMPPHPEWISPRWNADDYHAPSAAGIPGQLRIYYMPTAWQNPTLKQLEPGVRYQATLINPSTGERHQREPISGDQAGEYKLPTFPEQRNWALTIERA